MSYQHAQLAAGRWQQLGFMEQMANVGSEVERALGWRMKGNAAYAERAFERALELLDLTLAGAGRRSRLKELARVRETLAGDFLADGGAAADNAWRKYFLAFACAARKDR